MNRDLLPAIELSRAFIFECLAARLKGTDLKTAADLSKRHDFNWGLFLQVADAEYLSPLLYEILHGQQVVPPFVIEALGRDYNYFARRNLLLLHELGRTSSLLYDASLDVIVLKGAALVETVYKNIALRPMRDLDLLMRRDQIAPAVELLAQCGYEQTSVQRRYAYPVSLEKPGIELVVLDLHWTLLHSLHFEQQLLMDWFWETACTVTATSHPMRVLGLEAQVLHLCGHITYHHTPEHPQLLWLNDLAELIFTNEDKIDWDLLLDKAQTFQLILPLRRILEPIARDWGAPVPKSALQKLQTLDVSSTEMRAFSINTAVKQSEGQGYWLRLKEIRGWRRRLAYVLRWLFPSPATVRSRYHDAQLPMAYLNHFWTGIRLGVEMILTRLQKDGRS